MGFGVVLIAALGAGFVVGSAAGPLDTGRTQTVVDETRPTAPTGAGAMETETRR